MKAGDIYYDVEIETSELTRGERVANEALNRLDKNLQKVDKSTQKTGQGISLMSKAIAAVISVQTLRSMAGMVQQYQVMAERVGMATSSVEEYEMVQRRLLETANGTYRALSEAQEVYIRTADSLRSMGYSTSQALDITDALSYSFVTNATSADRAAAATSAFTKSLNTGRVAAMQWETLTSAIPTIIENIAASSGRGADEIRKLGAQGKLTAAMLSEGLRQARGEIKAAADSMKTDLVDAGVRSRNALTNLLVSLENQTGALEALTNGIITASEAVLDFSNNAENIEAVLTLASVAGASLASVIAGRLLTSMYATTAEFIRGTLVVRAKAAAELDAAKTAAALAAQNLIQAKAAYDAGNANTRTAATVRALNVAQTEAAATTARLTAAQRAMASTTGILTMAVNGLRTALMFLGGPAGLILMAASAIAIFGSNAKNAAPDVESLTDRIRELRDATLRYNFSKITDSLSQLREEARQTELGMEAIQRRIDGGERGQARLRRELEEMAAHHDTLTESIERTEAARKALAGEIGRRARGGQRGDEPVNIDSTGTEGETRSQQKYIESLRDRLALEQKVGLARKKLEAIQRLGADATKEEKDEAQYLVTQLHALEQQLEKTKGIEKNAEAIAELEERLKQASMNSAELAQRQAELSLNEYATPEQIEQIRQVALALQQAGDKAERVKSFGSDIANAIRGNVDPLSGGAFDDQYARYEAEAQAEKERYAAQLERLREAKELELEVVGGYQQLEAQMAEEHAKRMAQIEQAKYQTILASGESGFGAIAEMMKSSLGEQSSAYKAAFSASKAFSIALAGLNLASALTQALADPTATTLPQKFANVAAVATAGGSLVSAVHSSNYGSGRMYGGPVNAGSMYRINEGGKPEVFNAANGSQYMIPNQRGHVVSNANASPQGSNVKVVVNLMESKERAGHVEQKDGPDQEQIINIWVADLMGDGKTASAIQRKFQGMRAAGR